MEVAKELEDDLFFADLTKQISLLIMDDDDQDPIATCPSVSLQAFSCAIHPPAQVPAYLYEQSCKRETKGTGVFIPQSTAPRRRHNRPGKYTNAYNNAKPTTDHKLISATGKWFPNYLQTLLLDQEMAESKNMQQPY